MGLCTEDGAELRIRDVLVRENLWHFQDFQVGQHFVTMTRTPTETDIMTFVGLGGFYEELWINTRKAQAETLGRARLVPGYLTLIMAEGLYVLTGRLHHAIALLLLSDLRWSAPVAVGDAIHCEIDVEALHRSRSRPEGGVVTTFHRVKNHEGVDVMTYRTARMIRAHPD